MLILSQRVHPQASLSITLIPSLTNPLSFSQAPPPKSEYRLHYPGSSLDSMKTPTI